MKTELKRHLNAIEDSLTGSRGRLREMYLGAFSEAESERLVCETKKQNRKIATLLALLLLLVMALSASESYGQKEVALDLSRPEPGEAPRTLAAEVDAEYDGHLTRQQTSLRILPRAPEREEAEALLHALMKRLPEMILAGNASADAVTSDLSLPDVDMETGAELSWNSDDPRVLSREGKVNLIGVETGTLVTLTAYVRLGDVQDTFRIAVKMGSNMEEEQLDASLRERLSEAVKAVSEARDGESVSLPEETLDGVSLTWSPPKSSDSVLALLICTVVAFVCFGRRYKAATRRIESARLELERDFPDFIQKLGLLLDAGLVITSAITRITGDYMKTRDSYGRRRLYEELAALEERMRAGNTPLVHEFAGLAHRSGLRELMRFSSMLADNIDKGSTLADKLRTESELLWESRKKRAEKEGRVAETKLIFPMALQILAVIAVTVMPAAFEMG